MKPPIWVEKGIVLALHSRLLNQHGGVPGIRDEGLLDSALARPRNLYAYEQPGLFDLGAAYMVGIIQNHPFVDGNKRTGLMTGYVFLGRNRQKLISPETDTTQIIFALADHKISEADLAQWLRRNCKKQ